MINILSGTVDIKNVNDFIATLDTIAKKHNVAIQAVDADKVAGERHLKFAVEKAIRSWESGKNIASTIAMEILLYAAGKRQIEKALLIGVHKGKNNVAIVWVGKNEDIRSELQKLITLSPVIDYSERKDRALKDMFGITDSEIEAVGREKIPELVLERVALLEVLK